MSTAADQVNHQVNHLVCVKVPAAWRAETLIQGLGTLDHPGRAGGPAGGPPEKDQVVQRDEQGDSPQGPALHGLLGLLGSQDLPD